MPETAGNRRERVFDAPISVTWVSHIRYLHSADRDVLKEIRIFDEGVERVPESVPDWSCSAIGATDAEVVQPGLVSAGRAASEYEHMLRQRTRRIICFM